MSTWSGERGWGWAGLQETLHVMRCAKLGHRAVGRGRNPPWANNKRAASAVGDDNRKWVAQVQGSNR